ncbi:uncharacterized protein LOC126569330 [Anopheles aquasalis]|uniref:uncharacterized protein LOC126569330 n=1 Tax=Anopheles aquasalis TaxID=42839 RepID=UPI00215A3A47|nr:uncharacterized protein LOC126569330 [Anopheles aquasalis]
MASLKDWDVLRLSTLITNINAKLSASVTADQEYRLLCLVRQNDQILFRYTDRHGEVHLMLLCWFAENRKTVQDVCFDSTGCWLLVFCYDNTLHIVPALSICDKSQEHVDTTFNRDEITSFIVPFIGPHECPNPQTCPNNSHNSQQQPAATSHRSSIASEGSLKSACTMAVGSGGGGTASAAGTPSSEPNLIFDAPTMKKSSSSYTTHKIDEIFSLNSIYRKLFLEQMDKAREEQNANRSISATAGTDTPIAMKTIEDFFADASQLRETDVSKASTPLETYTISSSLESTGGVSVSCPYPTCCSWWRTLANEPRAILGYSDGSICVVALTPNCPFLGNTNCERGSIEKLIICQDYSMETISLMINTSTKEQWKLLLEQKSIKYTFPGDITPTSGPEFRSELLKSLSEGGTSESGSGVPIEDWQIVLSLPKDGEAVPDAGRTSTQQHQQQQQQQQQQQAGRAKGTGTNNEAESSGSSPNSSEPPSGDDFEKVDNESIPEGSEKSNDNGGSAGSGTLPKLLPAAKARLQSLRDLGVKKIGTLKLKLSESRIKAKEREKFKEQAANLAVMELPGMYPEILTTPAGPYFVVQYLEGKYLLSALHSYSDTLSVHSMDISLIPLHIYKLPKQCQSTVLTKNVLYVLHTAQPEEGREGASSEAAAEEGKLTAEGERGAVDSLEDCHSNGSGSSSSSSSNSSTSSVAPVPNAVSVVSCKIASMKMGDDCDFNEHALLGLFHFPDERILEIHRLSGAGEQGKNNKDPDDGVDGTAEEQQKQQQPPQGEEQRTFLQKSPVSNYLRIQKGLRMERKLDIAESQVMVGEFPSIEYDQALVVTDRNLYAIELADTGRNLFLSLAHRCIWAACEDFCTTFGLPLATCIEYAGDVLLRRKRISEALMTYNVARLSPMKTALKLALAKENKALMKLCAMALRNTHIIGSQFLMHDIMGLLVDEAHLGNVVYDSLINLNCRTSLKPNNTGAHCSDFSYDNDDVLLDVQISPSDQFHLSNLMFLTLCERCAQDKNYIPLWNFIVTNSKYHTSLACIMLAHGALHSTAVLLAMTRGTCLDVFSCLVGTWEQTSNDMQPTAAETNAFMYNLSNELFMECLTYLQDYTVNYFELIRKHLEVFDINVLERLIRQLNPFHPIYRPLLHRLSNHEASSAKEPSGLHLLYFCKALIETFLAVAVRAQTLKMNNDGVASFLSALKHIRPRHEERAVEMRLEQFSPIAAGFFHAAAVVRHVAFVWGSNGVNCALSRTVLQGDAIGASGQPPEVSFLRQIDLEVLAVQCGRLHTLLLTSNGLYAMGSNNLGQLGIGNHVINALQPMLVKSLDGKSITHFAAGQYHNAVVANGLLYTWGWGVFGQLGHGTVDDCNRPKVLEFFRNKTIVQLALGHAHTLVLCREHRGESRRVLYVFGSNHYGQLGLGQEDHFGTTVDTRNGKSFLVSLVPRKLELDDEITLINTKLFVNLARTTSNKLYIWGSSPQALRLATQARKRAKSNKSGGGFSKFSSMLRSSTPSPTAAPQTDTNSTQPADSDASGGQESASVDNTESKSDSTATPEGSKGEPNDQRGVDGCMAEQSTIDIPEITVTDESTPSKETPEVDDKPPGGSGEDAMEHLFPSTVDTSLVEGKIVKISSGLYHFALITDDGAIYTWGKNIERQLGREGGRNEVLIPTRLDSIEDVQYVECGADFTIVMTHDHIVKAWGNNNMGQCAKEISLDRTGVPGKLVRLPISNRVVRIPDKSQFIETPHEVKLPANRGLGYDEALRFLKSMPKYRRSFVVKSGLEKLISNNISTISSSLNDVSQGEVEDLVAELPEPSSDGRALLRDHCATGSTMSSLQSVSYATSPTSLALDDEEEDDEDEVDEEEDDGVEDVERKGKGHERSLDPSSDTTSSHLFNERHLLSNEFIHYCLYLFHGLYSQEALLELIKRNNEYHIRIVLLNYDYVEAFRVILDLLSSSLSSSASSTSIARQTQNLVKIFEYFTKDSSIVPMEVGNIKYFIYELFMFFIRHNLSIDVLEEFFLRHVDCYLVPLASVLYFHNTNNLVTPRGTGSGGAAGAGSAPVDAEVLALERKLLDKFNNNNNAHTLFTGGNLEGEENLRLPGSSGVGPRKLENTDVICRALSTTFNVTICQKLLEYFDRCK